MEFDNEDGMFLVIVGEEVSVAKPDQTPILLKQEYLDETDVSLIITDHKEDIEKHAVIKIEVEEEFENEHLDDVCVNNVSSLDSCGENYNPKNAKYVSYEEKNTSIDNSKKRVAINKVKKRYTMLKPCQQWSFVDELRQQYRELNDDPELLIDTLTEIMRDVKPPPLPQDYCKVQSINFVCVKCGTVSETLPAAGRHYQEKHGDRYLVCYACGVDFRSTTNLYKHEKRCIAPDASIVLKARSAFVGRKGRGRPFLSIRPPIPKVNKFPCSSCSAVFNSKSTLLSHENLHRGERPHRCHVCPAAYTSQSALLRHTKMHTDAQFICDKCSKSFKIKTALISHMETHNPLRKFKCSECDRRFSQKCAMLLHVNRVHRNLPPPFPCQVCPKRYPRMSVLKTHMKKEHNMVLMTRKMFFKTLPKLTEAQLQQAKVVLASQAPSLQEILDSHSYKEELINEEYYNEQGDKETYYGEDWVISDGEHTKMYQGVDYNGEDGPPEEESQDIPIKKLMQYFSVADSRVFEDPNVIMVQNGEIIKSTGNDKLDELVRETEMGNKVIESEHTYCINQGRTRVKVEK